MVVFLGSLPLRFRIVLTTATASVLVREPLRDANKKATWTYRKYRLYLPEYAENFQKPHPRSAVAPSLRMRDICARFVFVACRCNDHYRTFHIWFTYSSGVVWCSAGAADEGWVVVRRGEGAGGRDSTRGASTRVTRWTILEGKIMQVYFMKLYIFSNLVLHFFDFFRALYCPISWKFWQFYQAF